MDDVDKLLAGLRITEEIEIGAPVEHVWELVTDVTRIGEFSPECYRAEWLDGATKAAVGARFAGSNRVGERDWTRPCTVTELERGRRFGYAVGDAVDGSPASHWLFELESAEPGRTVLRQHFEHCPGGRTGLSWMVHQQPDEAESIIDMRRRTLSDGMRATLEAIKAAAETR